jgi:hypothetical protein
VSLHRVFKVLLWGEIVGGQKGIQLVSINNLGQAKVGCQIVKEVVV